MPRVPMPVPSLQKGYARNQGESEYPELWKGLVAAWPIGMQPQGPTRVYDLIKGNHGTFFNTPDWVTGREGLALDFNGTNEAVDTTFNINTHIPTHLNYGTNLRFRNDGGTNTSILWAVNRTYVHSHLIGSLGYTVQNDRRSGDNVHTFSWTPDANYHAVAVNWYQSFENPRLWMDGKELSTTTDQGSSNPTASDLVIGNRTQHNLAMEGLIYDFTIYNRKLTLGEIDILHSVLYAPFVPRRRIYGFTVAGAPAFPPNSLALTGVGR